MHTILPSQDAATDLDRWGIRRAVRLAFPGPSSLAADPEHTARLDVYLTDLLQPHGLALTAGELAPSGQSYGEMAEALIELAVPAGEAVDLLVMAYAMPDIAPGRATTAYLSHVCPGRPMAFAISDEGTAAAFTGLRLIREYARGGGFRRALLVVVEQAWLPYDPGVPVALPSGHSGVALLLGDVDPVATLGPVTVHADVDAASPSTGIAVLGDAETVILGAVLKDAADGLAGRAEVVLASPGRPSTGVWWELAAALEAAHGNPGGPGGHREHGDRHDLGGRRDHRDPGANRDHRIVLADADPDLGFLATAAIDLAGRRRDSGPEVAEWQRADLHLSVSDPAAASMNFLNEVAARFPDAVSLAAGRPYDGFYVAADIERYLRVFRDHLAATGLSGSAIDRTLLQYGRTNGVIGGLIARTLAVDEGIDVPPEAVMVTAGCQEAMIIALRGLCAGPDDVVLAVEPCYVGFTGAARILGIEVVPVPESADGLDPDAVRRVARQVRDSGRRPRALYVVPDFANPSGASMPVGVRRRLLEVASEAGLLILEDDPYGLFGLDDEPRPTLKALDRERSVIYLGSFAKSVFPGARVGYLVADQVVRDGEGRRSSLAEELSTVKSMLTVNTSPIAQAVVGGVLVDSGFSLRAANRAKTEFYRRTLRTLLAALEQEFGDTEQVTWNAPRGGFFAVLNVPFAADEALVEVSARDYGVLWTPMGFFYSAGGGENAIRLSCSALEPPRIEEGVRRLGKLVRDRLA